MESRVKYVILGMHKSGTTLLAKILHESGINMGPFKEKGSYYSGEFCEREDVVDVITGMLQSQDLGSLDTIPPFDERHIKGEAKRFEDIVRASDSKNEVWGFKDPRTVLVYDHIKSILGEHKLICVYRDLESVVIHYSRHSIFNIGKAIKAWRIYNMAMLDIIDKTDRELIVFDFEKMLKNDEGLRALERFVGIKLKDLRNPEGRKKAKKIKRLLIHYVVRSVLAFNVGKLKDITNELSLLENQRN